jgi:predicted Zn-dependent protease
LIDLALGQNAALGQNSDPLWAQAERDIGANGFEAAKARLNSAINLHPENMNLRWLRARHLNEANDSLSALPDMNAVLKANPANLTVRRWPALSYLSLQLKS